MKKQVLKVEIKDEIKDENKTIEITIEKKTENKTIEKEIKVKKVDLEEVIEEIIVEENIIETINNKIVDFFENKCLIIKALNLISNFTITNNKNTNPSKRKENYKEKKKSISNLKRRKEIIDILDSKYKNKMDSVAREHIIKLYVNDTTRFVVTL